MNYADKMTQDRLFLSRPQLAKITRDLPTPYFLYDGQGLQNDMGQLQEAFSWNCAYQNFFPVSVNKNIHLLRWLCQWGNGLVCTTHEEMELAAQAACPGEKVIYAPMVPMEEDLKTIRKWNGILLLDSMASGNLAIGLGHFPKRVMLGYNPMDKLEFGGRILARPDRIKQGMTFQAILILTQKLAGTSVEQLGLAGQMGSNILHPAYYGAVLHSLNQVRDQVESIWGKPIFAFQLGDGLAIDPTPGENHPDLQMMGQYTKEVAKKEGIPKGIAIQTAMGRRLLGPHGILITKVVLCKERKQHIVVVDLALSRVPLLQQRAPRHISVLESDDTVGWRSYDVVGLENEISCRLGDNLYLAPVEVGHHCVIHDMGYHGYCGDKSYSQYLYQDNGTVLPL